jgi:hypothetical protein
MRLIQIRHERRNLSLLAAFAGVALGSAVGLWLRPVKQKEAKAPGRWGRGRLQRVTERSPVIDAVVPPSDDALEDDLVAEIVRSELDRVCSHPDALRVSCARGVVSLEGPLLKSELNRVVRSVSRVPGVDEIHDHLRLHRNPWTDPASASVMESATNQ